MLESSAEPAASAHADVRPWWVLATLCSSLLIVGLNTTAMNTAIGVIAEDLSMGSGQVAWSVNAYLLAAASTVAAGGQFGDVLGRRKMFAIGLVVFAVGSVTIALASGTPMVIGGRALQGTGSGLLLPAQLALVRSVFPVERQGTAVGIWAATASFTFAVGPLYGGLFADGIGWRWLFAFDLVLLSISGALGIAFLRPVREVLAGRPLDLRGAAALGVTTIATIVAVQQGADWGWTSPPIVAALVLALAGAAAVVVIERRCDDPLVHFGLFRIPGYSAGVLTTFAQGFGLMGLLYFVAIHVESAGLYDESALGAGLVLLPSGTLMFVGALLGGRVADRIGFRVPITVALVLTGVGALALATVGTGTSLLTIALLASITGAGCGIAFSTTSAAGMAAVGAEVAGEAAGVVNMARYVGTVLVVALGTMIGGQVADDRLSDSLDSLGIPSSSGPELDRAMSQSASQLDAAIRSAAGDQAQQVSDAVRRASVDGFRAAELLIGVVVLVAAAFGWLLLRDERRARRSAAGG